MQTVTAPKPANGSRDWFRFQAAAGESDTVDIYVFDMIGGWIDDLFGFDDVTTAKTFLEQLKALPESVKTIRVHVNSPGGDVFSAVPIANMLRAESREKGRIVEVLIEGLAASAATIITSAGDTISIASNGLMMIHNPWSWAVGEAADMQKAAEELDKVRNQIIATYQWVSPLSAEKLGEMMDETTWMDAEEAVAAGFATDVTEPMRAAASLDRRVLARLGEIPARYREKLATFATTEESMNDDTPAGGAATPDPTPAPDAPADPTPAPEQPSNVIDMAAARAALRNETRTEVRNLKATVRDMCAAARRPDLESAVLDAALEGDLSIEKSREKLFDLMAASSPPEITNVTAPLPAAAQNKSIVDAIVKGAKRA